MDKDFDKWNNLKKFIHKKEISVVVFSQMRVISSNRLLRKLSRIGKDELEEVKKLFTALFS